MRILISYKEAYRSYADTLESVLSGLRPDAEVAVCGLAEMGEQLESFDPPPRGVERPEHRGSRKEGGVVQALSRARRTVRSLPRREALAQAQPTS